MTTQEPEAKAGAAPKSGLRRWAGWLVVPVGLLLASQFWPSWPRTHTLVLDLGGNSAEISGLEVTWTLVGEDSPRGGARRQFTAGADGGPKGAPRRLSQPIYGPSGAWEIHLARERGGRGDKTTSQHRVTLEGEETILFIKD